MASRPSKNDHQGDRPTYWKYSCELCKKDHPLKTCSRFLSLGPDERFEVACQYFYCLNCFARSHNRPNCPTELNCQICQKKHNTLLHFATQMKTLVKHSTDRPIQREVQSSSTQERTGRPSLVDRAETSTAARRNPTRSVSEVRLTPRSSVPFKWSKVFIATAQIKIAIPNEPGMWHTCRVSLNFHSTVSRIAANLQSQLLFETFEYREARFVKLRTTGRLSRFKWKREIRALLTNDLPRKPYERPLKEDPTVDFSTDTLADPDPRCNTAIDLELGADEFPDLWRNGSITSCLPGVIAQQTAIGYTFTGPVGNLW